MDKFFSLVKERYQGYDKGHDFSHIERVLVNALKINESEQEDEREVTILALVHDLYDEKFNVTNDIDSEFRQLVQPLNLAEESIVKLVSDLKNFGFKGGFKTPQLSKVGQIVSDADRLDAIGAIGIARAMMYGKILYTDEPYQAPQTIENYRNPNRSIIFHFYDKLLKLKDLMFTDAGRQMAKQRHDFMITYLKRLKEEIGVNTYEEKA